MSWDEYDNDFPVSDGRCVHCGQFTSQRESWRNDEQGWTIGYCKRCGSWVETNLVCWDSDLREPAA